MHPPAPRDGAQDDDASQLAAASSEASTSEAGASEAAPTATASSSTGEIEEALSGNVTRRSSPNIDAGSRSSSAPSLDSGRGLDGADAWSWRRTKSNSELLHALASKLEQQAADAAARVEAAAPGPADDAAADDYSSASPASVTASHAPAPPAPPAAAAADAFDVEATPTTDEVMGRDDDSAAGGGGSDDDDDDDDGGGGGGGGGRCRAKAAPAPPAAAEEAASPRPSGFVARRNSSTARLHEQAQAPPSPEAAGARRRRRQGPRAGGEQPGLPRRQAARVQRVRGADRRRSLHAERQRVLLPAPPPRRVPQVRARRHPLAIPRRRRAEPGRPRADGRARVVPRVDLTRVVGIGFGF